MDVTAGYLAALVILVERVKSVRRLAPGRRADGWRADVLAGAAAHGGARDARHHPGGRGAAAWHVQRPGHRDHRPAGVRGPGGRTPAAAGRAARAPDDLAAPAPRRPGGRCGGDHARDLARRRRPARRDDADRDRAAAPARPAGRAEGRGCRAGKPAPAVRLADPGGRGGGAGHGRRQHAGARAEPRLARRRPVGAVAALRVRPGLVRRGQRRHVRRGSRGAARRGRRGGGGAAPVPGRGRRRGDAQRGAGRAGGARDGRRVRPHAVR